MTMVAAPVSASMGVDTPPTSQRSQMVNSGSMPMAACSAAWRAPGDAGGASRRRRSTASGDGVPEGPGDELAGGRSRSSVAEQLAGEGVEALVAGDLGPHPHRPQPERRPGRPTGSARCRGWRSRWRPGLGVLAAVGGLHHGDAVVEVEVGHPPRASLVQVDRAGVDQAGARAPSTVPTRVPSGWAMRTSSSPAAAQAHTARGPAPPRPHGLRRRRRCDAGRTLQPVVEHQAAHAVVEQVAATTLVGCVRGSS